MVRLYSFWSAKCINLRNVRLSFIVLRGLSDSSIFMSKSGLLVRTDVENRKMLKSIFLWHVSGLCGIQAELRHASGIFFFSFFFSWQFCPLFIARKIFSFESDVWEKWVQVVTWSTKRFIVFDSQVFTLFPNKKTSLFVKNLFVLKWSLVKLWLSLHCYQRMNLCLVED